MVSTSSQRGFAESRGVLALVFGVIAGFCGICLYVLVDLRRAEWEQARLTATNLATAIQTDIARTVELFSLSLQGAAENFDEPEIGMVSARMRNLILFDRSASAKYIGNILVLDQEGRVLADSNTIHPVRQSHADADYFQVHQQGKAKGLYLGNVDIDGTGQYVLSLSQRVSRDDESFSGAVVGTLRLQYFLDTFRKLSLGPESSITLLRLDGTVLAREPFNARDYGRTVSTDEFPFDAQGGIMSFTRVSKLDGVERLFVLAKTGELPLIVSVGISTRHIDAGWWGTALLVGLLTIALSLITVTLVFGMRSESRHRRQLQDELATLARTDALTKLANRRGFDLVAERECRRATRTGEYVGLMMIDADRFKPYNDQFGHQAGDELLQRIASCVADGARRGTDFAARLGGEEFAILITGFDLASLQRTADGVRSSVEQLQAPHPSAPAGVASVSVGVACIKPDGEIGLSELMAAADRALYRAKDLGRNVVVLDDSVHRLDRSRRRAA